MKVGDYVRTKDGIIDKVIIDYNGYCASPNCHCKHVSCERNYYDEDKIIKSSPNIIDLVQEDDFVNGMRISEIKSNKDGILKCMVDSDYEFITTILNREVYSVLTKEQFEGMEYKI